MPMPIQTTYTSARANLAKLCDEVTKNQEIVIINRRGSNDVALVSAEERACSRVPPGIHRGLTLLGGDRSQGRAPGLRFNRGSNARSLRGDWQARTAQVFIGRGVVAPPHA